jgi:DNA primase catalytic core
MAGRIPQPFIDEVVARSDIVEIIGARVALKKSGREYKACCPFHNEKSPSFWVSPEKQFYHCFGCGAHGTVVGFSCNTRSSGSSMPSPISRSARDSSCRARRRPTSPAASISTR